MNPLEFSIFLVYDPKHNQIFELFICMNYLFMKIFQYWISVSGKVCESLGSAVNLKVKLESICAEVFSVSAITIKCQYVTGIIQRTGIYQSLIVFVEVNHVTKKGNYSVPRKKS